MSDSLQSVSLASVVIPEDVPSEDSLTVESFTLALEGFAGLLQEECMVEVLESRLLSQLSQAVRLLRWAIVRVEGEQTAGRFWCEGAYLKRATPLG